MRRLSLPVVLCLVCNSAWSADLWPEWRGVTGQGHSDAVNLPISWSESDNIAWKKRIPGRGHSTPVIANGKIWLTTGIDQPSSKADAARRRKTTTNSQPLRISDSVSLRAMCFDLKSGKPLHDVELMTQSEPQMIHFDNSYATPSPIFESGRLYCHFGPSGFACLDTDTRKVIWTNRDLVVKHENGAASTPVLWKNLLIVHCDGIDVQYIVALDKETGKQVWRTNRTGEMHENPQLRKAYATPLVADIDGRPTVISPAADWLYAYDPTDGRELWKLNYGELGFSNSARPVVGHGLIFICTGYMQSRLLAIRVTDGRPEIAWKYTRQVPAVASPLLIGERIFFASDKGIGTALNAKTGEKVWSDRLGARFWASPLYADGRVYFFDRKGSTVVISTDDKPKVLARNKLDGEFFAAAAAVDGALILRTDQAMYRVEP